MYVSRGPERGTPVLKVTRWDSSCTRNLMYISNLLDLTHFTQSSPFHSWKLTMYCCRTKQRPLPSCSRASVMPQQGVPPGACPVPIHVQPERNYGEIPSLSFTWADGSMASSTVVLRRSCRISRQLPLAMANLETDSYLGLLSLPNSLPVADWAIGLNSSLAFSSFVYPHPCWDSWWADYTFPYYDFSTWPSDLVWPGDSGEQDTSRSLKYSLLGFSHPHVEKHLPASLSTQVLEWVIWSRTIPTGPKRSKDTWARNKCCRPLELCSC